MYPKGHLVPKESHFGPKTPIWQKIDAKDFEKWLYEQIGSNKRNKK